MQRNIRDLFNLLRENPDLPVIATVENEAVSDECGYSIASFGNGYIEEYAIYEDKYYDDREAFKEDYYGYHEEDWKIFKEAIEKQEARKPIRTTLDEDVQIGGAKFCKGTHMLSHCPACGEWIVQHVNIANIVDNGWIGESNRQWLNKK